MSRFSEELLQPIRPEITLGASEVAMFIMFLLVHEHQIINRVDNVRVFFPLRFRIVHPRVMKCFWESHMAIVFADRAKAVLPFVKHRLKVVPTAVRYFLSCE